MIGFKKIIPLSVIFTLFLVLYTYVYTPSTFRKSRGLIPDEYLNPVRFTQDERIQVYVSLSTIPHRLPRIKETLRSLLEQVSYTTNSNKAKPDRRMKQTHPAEAIFLAIPNFSIRENKPYEIPSFLLPGGEYHSRVTILHDTTDWGPATKVITATRHLLNISQPDALLVIVDDDQFYSPKLLENYATNSKHHPTAALTHRGHRTLPPPHLTNWQKTSTNIVMSYELAKPVCVDIVTGVGSYAVRPKYFADGLLWEGMYIPGTNQSSIKSARNADDIWVSGILAMNGIPRIAVPGRTQPWTPEMSNMEYAKYMIVEPYRPTGVAKQGPRLSGASKDDNAELLKFFKDVWDCMGELSTLVPCDLKVVDGRKVETRRMEWAICRKLDGKILWYT